MIIQANTHYKADKQEKHENKVVIQALIYQQIFQDIFLKLGRLGGMYVKADSSPQAECITTRQRSEKYKQLWRERPKSQIAQELQLYSAIAQYAPHERKIFCGK